MLDMQSIDITTDPFEKYNVEEIKAHRLKLQQCINSKNEDLKNMVGKRYYDLLKTADTIKELRERLQKIMQILQVLYEKLNMYSIKSKLFIEKNSIRSEKWRVGQIIENKYSLSFMIKLLIETPLCCIAYQDNQTRLLHSKEIKFDQMAILLIFSNYIQNLLKCFVKDNGEKASLLIKNILYYSHLNLKSTHDYLIESSKTDIRNHESSMYIITSSLFTICFVNLYLSREILNLVNVFLLERKLMIEELLQMKINKKTAKVLPIQDCVGNIFRATVRTVTQAYLIFGDRNTNGGPGETSLLRTKIESRSEIMKLALTAIQIDPSDDLWKQFEAYFVRQYRSSIPSAADPDRCHGNELMTSSNALKTIVRTWFKEILLILGDDRSGLGKLLRHVSSYTHLGRAGGAMYEASKSALSEKESPARDHVPNSTEYWTPALQYFGIEGELGGGLRRIDPSPAVFDLWIDFGKEFVFKRFYEMYRCDVSRDFANILAEVSRSIHEGVPSTAADDNDFKPPPPLDLDAHVSFWKRSRNCMPDHVGNKPTQTEASPSFPPITRGSALLTYLFTILEEMGGTALRRLTEFIGAYDHRTYVTSETEHPRGAVVTCHLTQAELSSTIPLMLAAIFGDALEKELIPGIVDKYPGLCTELKDDSSPEPFGPTEISGATVPLDVLASNLSRVLDMLPQCPTLVRCSDPIYLQTLIRSVYSRGEPDTSKVTKMHPAGVDPLAATEFPDLHHLSPGLKEVLYRARDTLHVTWARLMARRIVTDHVIPPMADLDSCHCLRRMPVWRKVELNPSSPGSLIVTHTNSDPSGPSESAGTTCCVYVPATASDHVHTFLFHACQTVFRHFGVTVPRHLIETFGAHLADEVLIAFALSLDRLALKYPSPDHQASPQSPPSNIITQLLFDLRTVMAFLTIPDTCDDHDSGRHLFQQLKIHDRITEIRHRLESQLDPFDLKTLSGPLEDSIRCHVACFTSLYSILLNEVSRKDYSTTLNKAPKGSTDRGVVYETIGFLNCVEKESLGPSSTFPIQPILFYKGQK